MISKLWGRKLSATVAAAAVLTVYSMVVLAAPGARASGELSVSGEVTLNGDTVISGRTVFGESTIVTAAQSSASISISNVGLVQLSANSDLRLSLASNGITAKLENGSGQVSTVGGATLALTTDNGVVFVDGTHPTTFTVTASPEYTQVAALSGVVQFKAGGTVKQIAAGQSVSIGENVPAPTPTPVPPPGMSGLSGGALAALLLAAGGAVAAIIVAANSNNDFNFGGSAVTVSPTR